MIKKNVSTKTWSKFLLVLKECLSPYVKFYVYMCKSVYYFDTHTYIHRVILDGTSFTSNSNLKYSNVMLPMNIGFRVPCEVYHTIKLLIDIVDKMIVFSWTNTMCVLLID